MSNIEGLYYTLTSLKGIKNQDEPLVLSNNKIISARNYYNGATNNKTAIWLYGYTSYFDTHGFEECKKNLKSRIISLGLPLPDKKEITARFLEKNIIEKLVDEYNKIINVPISKIERAIKTVLKENPTLNNIKIFHVLVSSILENYTTDCKHLLNKIVIELKKIALHRNSNSFFKLNIDDEIKILQSSNTSQLEEILSLLQEQNKQSQVEDNTLNIEYNSLTEYSKNNVSLNKFKIIVKDLIAAGYKLKTAITTISDTSQNSNNSIDFSNKIKKIFDLTNYTDSIIIANYNQLSREKKQFITQFQFEKAVKHTFHLGYDYAKSISIILKIANRYDNFSSFHGATQIQPSKDEQKRGYGSSIDVNNIYNDAKKKLDQLGIRDLLHSQNISVKEEQTKRSRSDFQIWVNSLLINSSRKNIAANFLTPATNKTVSTHSLARVNDLSTQIINEKNISLSSMVNYGNTCWINASLKFIYGFYGCEQLKTAINKKLNDANKLQNQESQDKLKKLLHSFEIIIDAMSQNECVNIQIVNFLTDLHNYAVAVPQNYHNKQNISYINDRIISAFDSNNKIDIAKIQQQDADELISPLIDFLNLNSESNTLIKKSFKTYSFAKKDLINLGINIPQSKLVFEVEFKQQAKEILLKLPDTDYNNHESLKLKINYFRDYLARTNNANISNNTRVNILNNTIDTNLSENTLVPGICKNIDKLFADTKELTSFTLNINHGIQGANIRDFRRIKAELYKMLPSIKLEVIDTKTNQKYIVEARAETMVLFWGKGTGGHYSAISIGTNGQIFTQNDMENTTIEDEYYIRVNDKSKLEEFIQKDTQKKLIEYMDVNDVYPTNIGFKVISITPIK